MIATRVMVSDAFGVEQTTLYSHADNLGSPNVVTDEDGVALEFRQYDPFGRLRSSIGDYSNSLAVGFTGHEDEIEGPGLVNMGGRIYDPVLGIKSSPWRTIKTCPKCRTELHVRRKECDCGHGF